jgi:trigger factor
MSAEQNVSGFTEGLLGSKEGETREIPVAFPAEHPQKDLAGKSVTFKTTVTALKEKVLPRLDDDFAKDVGATDLATLRENVRRELETNRRRTERKDLEKQVIDELLQRNVFEVPASQVRDRAHQLTQQLRQFLKERGANDSDWAANEAKMLEKNRPEAERQVRLSYILGQILESEKLTVPDADVEAHIQKILGGSPAAQRKEIEEWMASRRENVRAQMREERLFDFLITNGKMTEGSPSATPS